MPPGKSPFAGLFKNALIRTSCISKLKAFVYKTFSKTSKTSDQSESKLRKLIRSFLAKDFSLKFNPPPACVSYKKEFHVSHELIFSHLAVLFFPTPLSNNNMSSRHRQSCEGNVSGNTGNDVICIPTMTSYILHQWRHTVSGNVSYPTLDTDIDRWGSKRIHLVGRKCF